MGLVPVEALDIFGLCMGLFDLKFYLWYLFGCFLMTLSVPLPPPNFDGNEMGKRVKIYGSKSQ